MSKRLLDNGKEKVRIVTQQDLFSSTQLITFNPILNESDDVRMQYYVYLKRLIRFVKWEKRKYTKSQLAFYKRKLCGDDEPPKTAQITFDYRFCYLLPFDLAAMCGFSQKVIKSAQTKSIIEKIISDFPVLQGSSEVLTMLFEAAQGKERAWDQIFASKNFDDFERYLRIVRRNIVFIKEVPFTILITATMSAGKSTLINALIGKNISRMQNMACTSKIHTIISKSFEDGVISEDDHDLLMDATHEDLLEDNEQNKSNKITVGSYFNGSLAGKRVVLLDSPGVNSSENIEHADISYQVIKSRKYKLMLYVLNSTQLGTNDEARHLEMIRDRIGRCKIVFVMNKVDQLISEDDNIIDAIEGQRNFLVSKGFKHPIICPVSSRAAYLVKKSRQGELSRIERREMENYMDKFEQQGLAQYYESHLKCDPITTSNEADELFVNCGFAYLEKIIESIHNGG